MRERTYMHGVRRLFTTPDGIDPNEYVIVRYQIVASPGSDLRAAAIQMALVASIGTVWPLDSESEGTRETVGPRILHPSKPDREPAGEVSIAFPLALFGARDQLAQLMGVAMFGGEYNYVQEIRVESIDLPRQIVDTFRGPRFGIEGFRKRIGVSGRPILGAILKPRLGVPLKELVRGAEKALAGGVDLIFDDELVVDPAGDCAFEPRIAALVGAAGRAQEKTGQHKGIVANVTSRPSHTRQYAEIAKQAGAEGLMFNGFIGGFPAMQDVAEGDWGLPLVTCNVGSGLLTRATNPTGVASGVFARLSRLAGGDAVQTGILAGDAYTTEAWGPSVIALDRQLGSIAPALPIVAGGLNIANLWRNWHTLGNDVIFAAGSGIFGFPGGPRAGAEAMRRMLDALDPEMGSREAATAIVKLAGKRGSAFGEALETYGFDPDELARADS